jgi:hypothetical protein
MRKYTGIFMTVIILTWAVCAGCDKTTPNTTEEKKPACYDSVAVLPISGELKIMFPGGLESQKTFLHREFPEELARAIARQRSPGSLKVISPTVVQEAQEERPGISVLALGRQVQAQTILIGKAVPETDTITFQLVLTETGELLWGQSIPVSEFKSGPTDTRPLLQDQPSIVQGVASDVVKTLIGDQQKK